jgi:hypothetical protein
MPAWRLGGPLDRLSFRPIAKPRGLQRASSATQARCASPFVRSRLTALLKNIRWLLSAPSARGVRETRRGVSGGLVGRVSGAPSPPRPDSGRLETRGEGGKPRLFEGQAQPLGGKAQRTEEALRRLSKTEKGRLASAPRERVGKGSPRAPLFKFKRI